MRRFRSIIFSALSGLLVGTVLRAQPSADTTRPASPPTDTLAPRVDSLSRRADLPQRWSAPHGSILGREEPGAIDKRAIVRSRYHTLFDILGPALPAQQLSNGTPAGRREFTVAGADPAASLPMQFDGRPLAMPGEAPWLVEWYPTEYLDRAELVDGARAFLFGGGRSLRLLNLVHPRFDVQGSYARAAYVQGENNTTVGDITYARNIGSEVALTVGFRRIASDGALPGRNSAVSLWNGRLGATWYPSDRLSIAFTELYTDASYGSNGGLTPTSSRTAALADVINDTLIDRTVRHDLTLSARLLFDAPPTDSAAAARVQGEAMRFEGAVYYTNNDPRLEVGSHRAEVQGGRDLLPADIVGLRAAAVLPLAPTLSNGAVPVFTHLLADAHASAAGLTLEGSGLVGFTLGDAAVLRGGALLRIDDAAFGLGVAGDITMRLGDAEIAGALALPVSLANDPPAAPPGDTLYIDREATRLLGEARVGWRGERWKVEAGGVVRLAERVAGSTSTVISPNAMVELPLLWNLGMRLRAVGTIDPDRSKVLPLLGGRGDLFGTWQLYDGNLDLQVGTTIEERTPAQLWEIEPESGRYFSLAPGLRDATQPFPLWSVWAVGRIGTAFIRVEWRNLLDVEYSTLYRYPEFRREILFSFNWAFID